MPAPLAAAVRRPVMLQHWRRLTFLHWPYPPPAVQALLPPGLEVETFDGAAWVGLVPFLMDGVRPPGVPPLPWASRFPETNVRTYALGPDGRGAIWFLSLDAARLGAVLTARASYALPYFWSRMSVGSGAPPDPGVTGAAGPAPAGPRVDRLAYRGRRRWPRPAGGGRPPGRRRRRAPTLVAAPCPRGRPRAGPAGGRRPAAAGRHSAGARGRRGAGPDRRLAPGAGCGAGTRTVMTATGGPRPR